MTLGDTKEKSILIPRSFAKTLSTTLVVLALTLDGPKSTAFLLFHQFRSGFYVTGEGFKHFRGILKKFLKFTFKSRHSERIRVLLGNQGLQKLLVQLGVKIVDLSVKSTLRKTRFKTSTTFLIL